MPKGAFDNTITYTPHSLERPLPSHPGRPLASAALLLWIGLALNKTLPNHHLLHNCFAAAPGGNSDGNPEGKGYFIDASGTHLYQWVRPPLNPATP